MTDGRNAELIIESCPECQVGALQPGAVSYFAVVEGMLVTVPNFPAWICDVCRYCEYDEDALEDLRIILGPSARIPSLPDRKRRLPTEVLPRGSRTDTRKGSK
jgi:YgiT-type zinc finger domain-containing protein